MKSFFRKHSFPAGSIDSILCEAAFVRRLKCFGPRLWPRMWLFTAAAAFVLPWGPPAPAGSPVVLGPEVFVPASLAGLKDPVAERPDHSDLCTSEFRSNSVRIQKKFSKFFRNPENSKTSQHFLECSAKSGEKIIKIWLKSGENCRNIMILFRNSNKNSKKFDELLRLF